MLRNSALNAESKLDYCNISILINCRFNKAVKKKKKKRVDILERQTPERYF